MPQSNSEDDFEGPLPPSLWKALNLPEPRRCDDHFAPEVDRDLLLRLVRKGLSKDMVRAAYRLIHAFDSWKQAYAEIVVQEFASNPSPELSNLNRSNEVE